MVARGHWEALFPEKSREILEFMRAQRLPYIAVCAEACGVPRSTMKQWLKRGDMGEAGFAEFRDEVYSIRARAALKMTEDIMDTGDAPGQRAAVNAKVHLLQKLSREDFDPPKEVYERIKFQEGEPHQLAQLEQLGEAMEVLSLPPGTMATIAGKKLDTGPQEK